MIRRNNVLQRRSDNLHGRRREHIEIELMPVYACIEQLIEQLDIAFQADALADFAQMLFANLLSEFRIVKQ